MSKLNEMEKAIIKNKFKRMLADLGMIESIAVLYEILQTGEILAEVLTDEQKRLREEGEGLDPS